MTSNSIVYFRAPDVLVCVPENLVIPVVFFVQTFHQVPWDRGKILLGSFAVRSGRVGTHVFNPWGTGESESVQHVRGFEGRVFQFSHEVKANVAREAQAELALPVLVQMRVVNVAQIL